MSFKIKYGSSSVKIRFKLLDVPIPTIHKKFFGTTKISIQNLVPKLNFPSHLLTNDSGNQVED